MNSKYGRLATQAHHQQTTTNQQTNNNNNKSSDGASAAQEGREPFDSVSQDVQGGTNQISQISSFVAT